MYAAKTTVSPERSQEDIKRALRRYKADEFMIGERKDSATVGFKFKNLAIRIDVGMPPHGTKKNDQTIRQRWRALLLCIKAKLEIVDNGISTIEQEFMPFVVMPDGKTLGEHFIPRLLQGAQGGNVAKLLPLPPTLTEDE